MFFSFNKTSFVQWPELSKLLASRPVVKHLESNLLQRLLANQPLLLVSSDRTLLAVLASVNKMNSSEHRGVCLPRHDQVVSRNLTVTSPVLSLFVRFVATRYAGQNLLHSRAHWLTSLFLLLEIHRAADSQAPIPSKRRCSLLLLFIIRLLIFLSCSVLSVKSPRTSRLIYDSNRLPSVLCKKLQKLILSRFSKVRKKIKMHGVYAANQSPSFFLRHQSRCYSC